MATLFKADGSVKYVRPASGKSFTLQEMQHYVGGYIELVGYKGRCHIYANEDGLMLSLPFNKNASLYTFIQLVGDVLVVTPEEAGEDTEDEEE